MYSLVFRNSSRDEKNVKCFCRYDTEPFKNPPIHLILDVDINKKIFYACKKTVFCSPSCARAFLYHDNMYTYDDLCMLNMYINILTSYKQQNFPYLPAPPL